MGAKKTNGKGVIFKENKQNTWCILDVVLDDKEQWK